MIYIDTSAAVKLVAPEAETAALQAWMRSRNGETFFASQLLRIELLRTVTRIAPDRLDRAREVVKGLALIRIDDTIVTAAESLPPTILRSLDAIHLATARSLGADVSAFVTYDVRLADAAESFGIPVAAP